MKFRFRSSFLAALWLFTVQAAAAVETLPDPRYEGLGPAERLEALLERVRFEQSRLVTLEAEFTQVKESGFLLEMSQSEGVFSYAAPDRVRWEYETPNPISLIIRGDEMITWYRDLGQAERVSVGKHSQRILQYLGAGSSMEQLLEYFTVSMTLPEDPNEPYRLDLAPRFSRVAKRVKGLTLWIDSERYLPQRLRFEEADGDVTDYRFHNVVVDRSFPEDHFEMKMPASVDVRYVSLDPRAGLR